MILIYIWILLGVFFTLVNRKYRITIERDAMTGKLILNYYVGNYLLQRLRTSLQLLGGERFEVKTTTLGGGSRGSYSVTAHAVCMIRNRRELLQTSAISKRSKADQVAGALQAFVRDPSASSVKVSAYQIWLLWLAIVLWLFAAAAAIAGYYYERAWQAH